MEKRAAAKHRSFGQKKGLNNFSACQDSVGKCCPHTCVYEVLWCERAAGNNWFIFIVLHLYIQELDAKGVLNNNDLIIKEFFIRQ